MSVPSMSGIRGARNASSRSNPLVEIGSVDCKESAVTDDWFDVVDITRQHYTHHAMEQWDISLFEEDK